MTVERHDGRAALAAAAARIFADAASSAVAQRGRFAVALSGGRTPQATYRELAGAPSVPWERTHVFWGDERWVPPQDARSNFHMAHENLLARVPIPAPHVHPVPVDMPTPQEAAERWEHALRSFFAPRAQGAAFPAFDLILLGMGEDGHVASLFSGDPALALTQRWTAAVAPRGDPPLARLTLTLPVLLAAREVLLLAAGHAKVSLLEALAAGDPRTRALPVARLASRPLRCLVSL
jgi:6-phosphogluconolactonase